MRAAIYINGSLGALNKSPQVQVLENRAGSSANVGLHVPHVGGSGKVSMRKQQVKEAAYLSAQRVPKESKKLQ